MSSAELWNRRVTYYTLRLLERRLRPAYVLREHGVTIVAIDPRHTMGKVAEALLFMLDDEESNQARIAYGWPPRGVPLDTKQLDQLDLPWPLYVPHVLRLPGEPALQGGPELERRRCANQLDRELEMYFAEEVRQTGYISYLQRKGEAHHDQETA